MPASPSASPSSTARTTWSASASATPASAAGPARSTATPNAFTATNGPVRTGETFVELTYQYQIVPWWTVQPDVQYVFRPGAGIADPSDPTGTRLLRNELVVGLRTNITF